MSLLMRLSSALVTSLPALVFGALTYISVSNDYYWPAYILTSGAFLVVSFLSGFFVPGLAPGHWRRHPGLWLFGQGMLAWLAAELVFALANFSPLCVGQDNGDGNNDLGLCMAQTAMVSLVGAPLEFTLLLLSAIPGGWLIKKMFKSEGT
ncbi:MAG: hypothetical protein EHM81_13070 [Chloroflexi bacterium]|nr:MAG: hypothetical protein EHM81_13070 [Chloroflexota bacterium]